jgi:hypothetical protein
MLPTRVRFARPLCNRRKVKLWGAPGAPIINMKQKHMEWKYQHADMVVEYVHTRSRSEARLLHYLGKHVPHPQKSLWSPDTPVMQDRHLFMLTTLDIDAFKYWFGVKRARLSVSAWKILAKAGLLPPVFRDNSKIIPKPIFDKEQLIRYFLANRKPMGATEKEDYLNYQNSMVRTPAELEADRPKAPWL